jgi:hypothetical protein
MNDLQPNGIGCKIKPWKLFSKPLMRFRDSPFLQDIPCGIEFLLNKRKIEKIKPA